MASQDDDFEALLREVDGVLGNKPAAQPANLPQKAAPKPSRQAEPSSDEAEAGGVMARLEAGLPVALASGAACGVVVWAVFGVLPLLSATSGGLGAFAAGTVVSLAGRLRRR